MDRLIVGLVSLSLGVLGILFRRFCATKIIEQQNKFWGFNFGESAVAAAKLVCVIVGIALLIVGFLNLFQVLRFK
jgi:hypothetical protein